MEKQRGQRQEGEQSACQAEGTACQAEGTACAKASHGRFLMMQAEDLSTPTTTITLQIKGTFFRGSLFLRVF